MAEDAAASAAVSTERFADHAVSVAHRVIWLVTGEFDPASEDSHEDAEDGAAALR